MNISRRIKLLVAGGALSLSALAGLAAGTVPAQAMTGPGPIQWHPPVSVYLLDCKFTVYIKANTSLTDPNVSVNLYEETNEGAWELQIPPNQGSATVPYGSPFTGPLTPYSLPYGVSGTGEYFVIVTADGFEYSSNPLWC